ncbi:hypothetical protein N9917_00830 [Deltaproteobacteria bacterium]|nr:hypothetical protein [Deltaproteobacteria bacterium]
MYEVWVTDGHYIQGRRLRGKAKTIEAAVTQITKALTKAGFKGPFQTEEHRTPEEDILWVEDHEGLPVGIIVKTR